MQQIKPKAHIGYDLMIEPEDLFQSPPMNEQIIVFFGQAGFSIEKFLDFEKELTNLIRRKFPSEKMKVSFEFPGTIDENKIGG